VLKRFAVFLSVFQSILLLAHFLLFETLVYVWKPRFNTMLLAIVLAALSVSFLSASLLAFRHFNVFVRVFYKIAAVWLGIFNYLFMAACVCWLAFGALYLVRINISRSELAAALFGLAIATALYGFVNAAWIRVKHISVQLPALPQSWRGRNVALVSDLHLGHVRNFRFTRRIVRKIARENPAAVLIAGDLFDGTAVDAEKAAAPLAELHAPFGTYFAEGNHEEFSNPAAFLAAISKTGVRVLDNEIVNVEGLQLIGVPYRHATHAEHFRSVLQKLRIDRTRASILITHAPDRPQVADEAGISLQVSGHTHRGQFFPYTWITARIYRQFVYGLTRVGELQVYTSCGAGTWGPPLRVGSQPEIVLIHLK
jgi:uncharacterized protein